MALSMTITPNVNFVVPGLPIVYTITIANTGSAFSGVLVYTAASPATPTLAQPVGTMGAGIMVPMGGTYTTFSTLVVPSPGGPVSNTLTLQDASTLTPVTSASPVPLATSTISVGMVKGANVSSYLAGQTILYSYLVINRGVLPVVASISDTITGSTVTTVTPTFNGSPVATILPNEYVTFMYAYPVGASTPSSITNVATLNIASLPTAVTSTLALTPTPTAVSSVLSVMLTKTGPALFNPSTSTITYTYMATNTGSTNITDPTLIDDTANGSVVITPFSPLIIVPGGTATTTGTYTITPADVIAGYISNFARIVAQTPSVSPTTDSPAYAVAGFSSLFTLACIHGDSEVTYVTAEGKEVPRAIATIREGDYILNGVGAPAKVTRVVKCWDKHPKWEYAHRCVVFPPDSLDKGIPTQKFIVDSGHPIATLSSFANDGLASMMPAGSFVNDDGKGSAYRSDWKKVANSEADTSTRYDLIIEGPSATYMANGLVVKARISLSNPGYHHEIADST